MSTIKQTLRRIADSVPESRSIIVPFLRRHEACACGDQMLASELDEMFAGRQFDPHDPKTNGDYAKNVKDEGKWIGDNRGKGKCYYQTGDPKDRCYVTTNGGPGGQTKPDSGSTKNRSEYNKKYIQQRWPGGVDRSQYKKAEERLAAIEAEMLAFVQAGQTNAARFAEEQQAAEKNSRLNDLRWTRLAAGFSKMLESVFDELGYPAKARKQVRIDGKNLEIIDPHGINETLTNAFANKAKLKKFISDNVPKK